MTVLPSVMPNDKSDVTQLVECKYLYLVIVLLLPLPALGGTEMDFLNNKKRKNRRKPFVGYMTPTRSLQKSLHS